MSTVNITVYYGNLNHFNIELSSSVKLGYLSSYISDVVNKTKKDILYLIMGGQIIGSDSLPFDMKLDSCNIVNDKCVIHVIFAASGHKYPDADVYIRNKNIAWVRNNEVNTTVNNFTSLLQAFGATGDMVDVPVVINEEDYLECITTMNAPAEQPCSICSQEIDIDTEIGVLLPCRHPFHDECIKEWLTVRSVRCPTCNHDVRDSSLL